MRTDSTESALDLASFPDPSPITDVPPPDKNTSNKTGISHPPSPEQAIQPSRAFTENTKVSPTESNCNADSDHPPPELPLSREEIRFLADVAARPLSTTVSRYQRLHLSRHKGNAIRQSLISAGLIEAVPIATRSGQVVLYDLTDPGRAIAETNGIDSGLVPRAGLERIILLATSPSAMAACQRALTSTESSSLHSVEVLSWLDIV